MTLELVLVPGMCSVGSVVYRELVQQLETTLPQATIHVIDLPSTDAIATKTDLEPNGLEADIAAIRYTVKSLVEAGRSVVVVAHSYGGTASLYACEGFWKAQMSGNATGSVLRIGLLSSSLALPGDSVASDRQSWMKDHGYPEDPMPQMEQHGKETFLIPFGFEHAWMNDLPDHAEIRGSLRPSPLSILMTPTPHVDVRNWDIAYLATAEIDLGMPEAFQKYLVDRAKEKGAKVVSYETIKSGHFLQVSHANEVAKWIASII